MTSPPTIPRRRPVLLIVVLDTLLVLAALEIVPRLVQIPGLTLSELNPAALTSKPARRFDGHPYISHALKPNWRSPEGHKKRASHNALGFRGDEITVPKPEGTYRILCVGGSSTYGSGPTENKRTYPARLEHHLHAAGLARAEVINLGAPGWTSTESLINLSLRGVELEPDLVIIYHATNDGLASLWPDATWDQTHFRATWSDVRESPLERMLARSRLYLIWRAYLTDHLDQRLDQGNYGIVNYDAKYTEPDFDRHIPETGINNYRRNLRSMTAIARANGSKVVFVEQAFHPEEREGVGPHSGFVRVRAISMLFAAQRSLASEIDVPVIPAAEILEGIAREQLERDGKQTVFTNNVHLRNIGANILGQTIAEELFSRAIVPVE